MKEIKLTKGKVAFVDDDDFDWLNQWKWYACGKYARRIEYIVGGKGKGIVIWMHRVLMSVDDHKCFIDHKDRDGLNNQRNNLRIATHSQNMANRNKADKKCHSKYFGVTWNKQHKKWMAVIQKNGTGKTIGYFYEEICAAKAYNRVAIELHGEFANLNNL